MKHCIMRILFSCCVVIISACTSIPTVPVKIKVNASEGLNYTANHQSLPVRVKIYQLTNLTPFEEATFHQLWKSDTEILGNTLLDKQEITVVPMSSEALKLNRKDGAKFIGVVALFRQPNRSHWRSAVALPNQASTLITALNVSLKGNNLEIK